MSCVKFLTKRSICLQVCAETQKSLEDKKRGESEIPNVVGSIYRPELRVSQTYASTMRCNSALERSLPAW